MTQWVFVTPKSPPEDHEHCIGVSEYLILNTAKKRKGLKWSLNGGGAHVQQVQGSLAELSFHVE